MLAGATGLILAAVTLFSFLGDGTWLGELSTHFRPHLALASLVVLAVAAFRRSPVGIGAAAACFVANAVPLVPYLAGSAPAPAGTEFRVLTLNLHRDHADYDAVADLIESEQPDLVVLTEFGAGTEGLRERVRTLLPTMLWQERRGSFEVIVLTRWRTEEYRVDRGAGSLFPVTHVRLCRERCLNLVAMHAARPIDNSGSWRAAQFAIAAKFAAEGDLPTVLLGDLNCTPWSPAFDGLLAAAGLHDTARGLGLWPTWLSALPFIGLPIDHVLVNSRIGVRERRVGPDVGSDHFPVSADLVVSAE